MRRDAKASSAGSTSGQGASLGSFVLGAFAIRGSSGGADGSGARSIGAPCGLALAVFVSLLLAAPSSFAAEVPCSNQIFRTGAGASLPECRAYEQVTPPTPIGKNGNNMTGSDLNVLYASPSGDATTYSAITGAGDTESSVGYPIYIASRGMDNWSSTGFNPPAFTGTFAKGLGYTEDLSGGYTMAWYPGVSGGLYLRETNGQLVTIATGITTKPSQTAMVSESADRQTVVFESQSKLTSNAISKLSNVYAWSRSTGDLTLVDVLPDGSTPVAGSFAGPWEWSEEGISGGSKAGYYTKDTLSRDGSRAFFTTADTHQIYLREDPTSSSGSTTLVSGTQKTNGSGPGGTDPNGPLSADYLEATPSGSFVFFKSHEELTNDANTGPANEGQDLYRYEVATGSLIDLSADASEAEGANVLGLVGASADGSYAYFVARGDLAAGATAGDANLYVWHDGETRYLTKLESNEDALMWLNTRYLGQFVAQKAARVTPDGKTILFSSIEDNPGFDSNGYREIYRWEYGGPGLQCLSCNLSGIPAVTSAALQERRTDAVSVSLGTSISTRNLSPDGKRVFFVTAEALVDRDVNGVEDVYEWEAKGKGSCTDESENGGCLYLISTGTSPEPSYFTDASESGDDVFFITTQRLVGQDKDEYTDFYDARVGGGLAAQNSEPARPCEGEACLGAGTAPASQQARGTSAFAGSGNERPKKKHSKKKKKHKKRQHHRQGARR